MQELKFPFVFAAADTTKTLLIGENGFVRQYFILTPNYTTAAPTTTLTVKDRDGYIIYTSAAHAENNTPGVSVPSLSIPVNDGYTVTATLSGAAGGDHTCNVKFYVEDV